jgi:deoxycytidylate deaminase
MIINAGIREVVYKERYSVDGTAKRILGEAGVKLRPLADEAKSETPA